MKQPARTFRLGAALWLLLAVGGVGDRSEAAVRTCTARLTGIPGRDATELGAKKKAIDDWLLKARGAGIAEPAWRLAAEKRLICQSVPDGNPGNKTVFECIAVGHACTILQNPNPGPSHPPLRGFGVDT